MSLFIAYTSDFSPDEAALGLARVARHYDLPADHQSDAFHHEGLGAWFAWRDYDNQKAYRHARERDLTAFLTHIPYGYSRTVVSQPGDPGFAAAIGRRLMADPEAVSDFAAPFASVTTDRRSYVRIAVDGVGLARLFHYRTARGTFVSNRAVAAILMSGEVPGPCETGWASQLMFGFFWDDLSPFEGVKTFVAGEHLTLTAGGVQRGRANAIRRWMQGEAEPVFDGFDRTVGELQQAVSLDQINANLSGGKDSRVTAAIMTAHMGERVRLRTYAPPLVERDVASLLVERLPYVDRIEESAAWTGGRRVWECIPRSKGTVRGGLMARARAHLANSEGMALSTHMANSISPVAALQGGTLSPGVGGGGGEIAKGYGWTDERRPGAILREIKATRMQKRLRSYVFTSDRSVGMLGAPYFLERFWPILTRQRADAAEIGVRDYHFLSLHYLITRIGRGLLTTDRNISLLMTPAFISAALKQSAPEMVGCALHERIISHYRPEWTDVAYERALQADASRRVAIPSTDHLWRGANAGEFRDIIANRSWFEAPYDHAAILHRYDALDAVPGLMNQRGYDLVYRAAFMEMLGDLKAAVSAGQQFDGEDLKRARLAA